MSDETLKTAEWQKLFEYGLNLLGLKEFPHIIGYPVGVLIIVAVVVAICAAIMIALGKMKEIWADKLRPAAYSPEDKRRAGKARLFASHILNEINQRNVSENWRDDTFAELEAEVEAEGRTRVLFPLLATIRAPTGIRRERSLTRALQKSTERLILLEGEPGSGKSVALRHFTRILAEKAGKSRRSDSILPIFVNLKELRHEGGQSVDRNLIYSFIRKTLNRINDRYVDEFLDEEFDQGIKSGRWVFVFDSFDELPGVLSSTESDSNIQLYSTAISDFLSGLNSCRGIVASRVYRGPAQKGWRKFRIVDLSPQRQDQLISKALLQPRIASTLRGQLAIGSIDIQMMAKNPMFLGLLCEHMRAGHPFPTIAHEVYEKYINTRFERDEHRIRARFNINADKLKEFAELVAFAIATHPSSGLSPARDSLKKAIERSRGPISNTNFNLQLDALEYMRLGRGEAGAAAQEARQFTFAHRRFQEYFATCVVIKAQVEVPPNVLLTDATWRETIVVLCQTGKAEDIEPLLKEAYRILSDAANQLPKTTQLDTPDFEFPWPPKVLHVLGILQDGFGASKRELPAELKDISAQILLAASKSRSLLDRKLALEVAGVAPERILIELIRASLVLNSQWIQDIVYLQVARISVIPRDVLQWLRTAILVIALGADALRKREVLRAHIARLNRYSSLKNAMRLAYLVRPVDLLGLLSLVVIETLMAPKKWQMAFIGIAIILTCSVLYWRAYYSRLGTQWTFVRLGCFCLMMMLAFPETVSDFYRNLLDPLPIPILHKELPNDLKNLIPFIGIVPALYIFLWPNAAVICAENGTFLRPMWWPLIPLQCFLTLYHALSKKSGAVFRVTMTLAVFAGLVFLSYWTPYAIFILSLISIISFPLAAIAIAVFSWRAIVDYLTLRRIRNWKMEKMNTYRFYEIVQKFKLVSWKFRFANFIRTRGLLSDAAGIEPLVKIIAATENENDDYPEFRDEIYMLLEQLRRSHVGVATTQP